jgi:flavodoxin I
MEKIAIFYGSSTGNTKNVATTIKDKLTGNEVDLFDVANAGAGDLEKYENIILGTSTWGIGDLQDDWESFIKVLEKADINGKVVALFGLGDAYTYSDSFVDGMGIIYEAVKDKGIKITGMVQTDGYDFDKSKAIVDGSFVGLPIDEDNNSNLTDSRIGNWVKKISKDFK